MLAGSGWASPDWAGSDWDRLCWALRLARVMLRVTTAWGSGAAPSGGVVDARPSWVGLMPDFARKSARRLLSRQQLLFSRNGENTRASPGVLAS